MKLDTPLKPVKQMTDADLLDEITDIKKTRTKRVTDKAKVTKAKTDNLLSAEVIAILKAAPPEKQKLFAEEKLNITHEKLLEMMGEKSK